LSCMHRECSHESVGERILNIGPYLPKLSNVKGHTFLGHSIYAKITYSLKRTRSCVTVLSQRGRAMLHHGLYGSSVV